MYAKVAVKLRTLWVFVGAFQPIFFFFFSNVFFFMGCSKVSSQRRCRVWCILRFGFSPLGLVLSMDPSASGILRLKEWCGGLVVVLFDFRRR